VKHFTQRTKTLLQSNLIWILVACSPSLVFAEESITLSSGEWLPFQSEHLKHGGVVSHIVAEAFENAGINIELIYLPWKRGYDMAKRGEIAGSFVWSKKPNRMEHFLFSETLVQDLPVLFYRKDNPVNWVPGKWDSLNGLSVGATIGYTYPAEFKKYEDNGTLKVERVSTDQLNFRKLILGRIDAFPASLNSGYALLQTIFNSEEINQLDYHPQMPPSYKPTSFHLILSKKHPNAVALIEKFNEELSKLKQSGLYQDYFEQSRQGAYK